MEFVLLLIFGYDLSSYNRFPRPGAHAIETKDLGGKQPKGKAKAAKAKAKGKALAKAVAKQAAKAKAKGKAKAKVKPTPKKTGAKKAKAKAKAKAVARAPAPPPPQKEEDEGEEESDQEEDECVEPALKRPAAARTSKAPIGIPALAGPAPRVKEEFLPEGKVNEQESEQKADEKPLDVKDVPLSEETSETFLEPDVEIPAATTVDANKAIPPKEHVFGEPSPKRMRRGWLLGLYSMFVFSLYMWDYSKTHNIT